VADFISISDRTGSMSMLMEEKAVIAVHVPQLFCLKHLFVPKAHQENSNLLLQIIVHSAEVCINKNVGWWAGAVSNV